jgi:methylglutamate dehydrogenase subunit D
MPVSTQPLAAQAPFAMATATSAAVAGVAAIARHRIGLATVLVHNGKDRRLADRLRKVLSLELPPGPRRTSAGDVAFLGVGPGAWLATLEQGGNAFARGLNEGFGELASISDQTDGLAVLRVTGLKVRDALARLVPLDLHPREFKVGNVASTRAALVGVTLWRLEDLDGSAVFEIALYRSLAGSFWRALCSASAECGLTLEHP